MIATFRNGWKTFDELPPSRPSEKLLSALKVLCNNYMLENIKILLADENFELFLVVEKSIHAALGRHDYATAVSLHVKDQVSPLLLYR